MLVLGPRSSRSTSIFRNWPRTTPLWRKIWPCPFFLHLEGGLTVCIIQRCSNLPSGGHHCHWCRIHPSFYQVKMKVAHSCPILCDPTNCSPSGSSVHRILQARLLEWIVMPFSRGSSWPREWTWVSCIAGRFFTVWATREAPFLHKRTIQTLLEWTSEMF